MQIVLLAAALSTDIFLACMACGAGKIKIEGKTALCISLVCSGVLFLSLTAGKLLGGMVKKECTDILCFAGLFLVGAEKLSEYGIKAYIRKHKFLCKRVKITFSHLNFILSIYNNPIMADRDHSSTMSVTEGVSFALAMSVDGLFGGISATFLGIDVWKTVLCNLLLGYLAVTAGSAAGMAAAQRKEKDLSWVGGVLFILLAFTKLA